MNVLPPSGSKGKPSTKPARNRQQAELFKEKVGCLGVAFMS
jgi:hypothetical protein